MHIDDAQWAYKTAFKTPLEMSYYRVVYCKVCRLPIELQHMLFGLLKN